MGIEVTSKGDDILITLTDGIESDIAVEWAYVDRAAMEIVPVALNTLIDEIEKESMRLIKKELEQGKDET